MLFPVQKDVNGFYHINLDWNREYLPYFTIDLIASIIHPEYRYNGVSVVTAEFYSKTSWTLENSGVEVDILQDTHVYFKDNGLNLTSKRIVGPFHPKIIGDTVQIDMEVFWDAGMQSVLRKYSEKFIVK